MRILEIDLVSIAVFKQAAPDSEFTWNFDAATGCTRINRLGIDELHLAVIEAFATAEIDLCLCLERACDGKKSLARWLNDISNVVFNEDRSWCASTRGGGVRAA